MGLEESAENQRISPYSQALFSTLPAIGAFPNLLLKILSAFLRFFQAVFPGLHYPLLWQRALCHPGCSSFLQPETGTPQPCLCDDEEFISFLSVALFCHFAAFFFLLQASFLGYCAIF